MFFESILILHSCSRFSSGNHLLLNMCLARYRQYIKLANSLHNITVIRTFFVHCESKMLGLCLNILKSIAGTSILWPCNLPYFRNSIWNNDKFSSSITSPMTAQRNLYFLAYAGNFFTQKQLLSGKSSQPVSLLNSFSIERSKTNSRQHSVSWFGSSLFSPMLVLNSPGLLKDQVEMVCMYDQALGSNSHMTSLSYIKFVSTSDVTVPFKFLHADTAQCRDTRGNQ